MSCSLEFWSCAADRRKLNHFRGLDRNDQYITAFPQTHSSLLEVDKREPIEKTDTVFQKMWHWSPHPRKSNASTRGCSISRIKCGTIRGRQQPPRCTRPTRFSWVCICGRICGGLQPSRFDRDWAAPSVEDCGAAEQIRRPGLRRRVRRRYVCRPGATFS